MAKEEGSRTGQGMPRAVLSERLAGKVGENGNRREDFEKLVLDVKMSPPKMTRHRRKQGKLSQLKVCLTGKVYKIQAVTHFNNMVKTAFLGKR